MYVKFPLEDLNFGPYPPHLTSTCTCKVIIVPRVHSSTNVLKCIWSNITLILALHKHTLKCIIHNKQHQELLKNCDTRFVIYFYQVLTIKRRRVSLFFFSFFFFYNSIIVGVKIGILDISIRNTKKILIELTRWVKDPLLRELVMESSFAIIINFFMCQLL